jgi:hypothetical protein
MTNFPFAASCRVLDDGAVEVSVSGKMPLEHDALAGAMIEVKSEFVLQGPEWDGLIRRAEAQRNTAFRRDAVIQAVRPNTLLRVREDGSVELSVRVEAADDVHLYRGERFTATDVLTAEQWDQLVAIVAEERTDG